MNVDAIVVLGCALERDGQPGPALQRRLQTALKAWHRGISERVVTCGGRRWWGQAESAAMIRTLVEAGVPAEAVVPEYCSLTTRENALYFRRRARRFDFRRIALVTCDFHMPRALHCFEREGFECVAHVSPTPTRAWHRGGIRRGLALLSDASIT